MTDLSGVCKSTFELRASDRIDVNLSGITTGIYFLKLVDSKGKILLQTKLVVIN
jgi:hypothetical protein